MTRRRATAGTWRTSTCRERACAARGRWGLYRSRRRAGGGAAVPGRGLRAGPDRVRPDAPRRRSARTTLRASTSTGRFLYGAPAAGPRARRGGPPRPRARVESLPGYFFGLAEEEDAARTRTPADRPAATGDDGKATFAVRSARAARRRRGRSPRDSRCACARMAAARSSATADPAGPPRRDDRHQARFRRRRGAQGTVAAGFSVIAVDPTARRQAVGRRASGRWSSSSAITNGIATATTGTTSRSRTPTRRQTARSTCSRRRGRRDLGAGRLGPLPAGGREHRRRRSGNEL